MNNDMAKSRIWTIGAAVGVLLAIFLLVLSIKELKSIKYVGTDNPIMSSITVNGKGEVVSIPDVATFSFSVSETGKAVDEAQAKATEKINSVIATLKSSGIAEKDIKTTSYSINPHYEYTESLCIAGGPCRAGKSTITGYDVSQSVEVKIRDLKKAGAIFTSIGSLDVQNINGLNFSIDDIDTVKAEARDLAIANAQEKAKTLAKKLGVNIVRVTSFYDSSEDQPYYGQAMATDSFSLKASIAAPAPEIPAGEQKVISKISITYEIN